MLVSQSTLHLAWCIRQLQRHWLFGPVVLVSLIAGWVLGVAMPLPSARPSAPAYRLEPVRVLPVPYPRELPQVLKFGLPSTLWPLDPVEAARYRGEVTPARVHNIVPWLQKRSPPVRAGRQYVWPDTAS